jgi:hypothetical protein
VEVYAAIDREGDIAVLVKETDMVLDAFVGVYAAIDREGDIAALVKETVDMVLQVDVLVVGFQWARRKD